MKKSDKMSNLKQIIGLILIIIAIVLFILSYNAYINGYHKAVSNISNFSALFVGIFWFFVLLIVGAVFFAIGLILFKPKWAKWKLRGN